MIGVGLDRRTKVLVTIGVMLTLLLASLDQTIVGTAMPRIISELNGLDRYAWVTTAYLVTSTVMTPIAGKLGDLFGRKPFILTGVIGFMAMSWLCGASQDMNQLVFFRGAQGLFGGMLFASVFTVLADIFPPDQRARMQGLFGAVFGISSIFGPTLGGWITDNLGWRWVFYVNIPVGVLAVALIAATLPFVRSQARLRDIDFLGALTMAAGLTPILIGLTITNTHSWTSPEVIGLIASGLVLMALFLLIEGRAREPIVPLSLWRNRVYTVATMVGVLSSFGMFGTIIFVPLIFQGVLGQSATNSGTLITPMMFGLIGASMVTGQLMVRIKQYRYLGTLGLLIAAFGFYLLSAITVRSSQLEVTEALVLVGIGLGVTFPLYITTLQSAVEPRFLGVVSSNTQFWRNVGGTIATAIFGSILASRLPINIRDQLSGLSLPPQAGSLLQTGGNAQQLFNQAAIAAQRGALPPAARPLFDQVLLAVRTGLAQTLHELFLIGIVAVLLAAVVTLFMPYVELRRQRQGAAQEAPAEAEARTEPQTAIP
ncbi:MAG TPA: MDR family MFS transporter [Candidatus Dormibacteraeota bacterium]